MRNLVFCTLLVAAAIMGGTAAQASTVIVFDGAVGPSDGGISPLAAGRYHARLSASSPATLGLIAYYETNITILGPGFFDGETEFSEEGLGGVLNVSEISIDFEIPRDSVENWPDGFVTYRDISTTNLFYYTNGPVGTTYHLTLTADLFPPGNVPEPAAWALMTLGFGGVGAMMRRSRRIGLNSPVAICGPSPSP